MSVPSVFDLSYSPVTSGALFDAVQAHLPNALVGTAPMDGVPGYGSAVAVWVLAGRVSAFQAVPLEMTEDEAGVGMIAERAAYIVDRRAEVDDED